MRLLAIGYPLPNKDIENYNPLTAPSYFDYDGLFIDPASVTGSVQSLLSGDREWEAFDGRAVLNAPTTPSAVSGADQVRRRSEETRRLLEAGRTVMVMGRPNVTQAGLVGFEGLDRYSWLPAPSGMNWGAPHLLPAEGRNVRVVAEDHPLAGFLRRFRPQVGYRAVFDERQAPVRQGRVLATGGTGGMPVAMEFDVLGGRLVFVPALSEETGPVRAEIAEAVVDLFLELARTDVGQEAPYWERSYALPGLEQAEAELEEVAAAAKAAREQEEGVRARHDALVGHRALLWAEGRAFQRAVESGLRALGFELTVDEQGRLEVESEGKRALVECESSREAVVEWPYVRLQRRIEAKLLQEKTAPGGLIVANGERMKDPSERKEELAETLIVAAGNYRYGLLTGHTLFTLVQRALGGADEASLTGMRRRLMGGVGLLSLDAALGEMPESSDTGPIF